MANFCKMFIDTIGKIFSVTFWPMNRTVFDLQDLQIDVISVTYQIKAKSLTNPWMTIKCLYFNYFRKYLRLSNLFLI